MLRIDNGEEFYGNEFEEFMWELWNSKEKDYSLPQQDGVAEIMNMTLMEKTSSILSGAGLSH